MWHCHLWIGVHLKPSKTHRFPIDLAISPSVIHPIAIPLLGLQCRSGEGDGGPSLGHTELGDAGAAQRVVVERGEMGADEQRTLDGLR